jgi:hypothetical protein
MSSRARVLVALTCSGAAGLTSELVWARHAARVIGHADGAIASSWRSSAGLAVRAVTALAQACRCHAPSAYAVELGIATAALLAPLLTWVSRTPLSCHNEGHGGAGFAARPSS